MTKIKLKCNCNVICVEMLNDPTTPSIKNYSEFDIQKSRLQKEKLELKPPLDTTTYLRG